MQNNQELLNNSNNTANIIPPESIFNKTCNEISNRLIGGTSLPIEQNINITGQVKPQVVKTIETVEPLQIINKIPNNQKILIDDIQSGGLENNSLEVNNNYYSIFGFEYSLWTWILILLILLTIIYFIYKWFFSTNEKIVTIKKSKNTIKTIENNKSENPNEELNKEITDSEENDSSDDSETE